MEKIEMSRTESSVYQPDGTDREREVRQISSSLYIPKGSYMQSDVDTISRFAPLYIYIPYVFSAAIVVSDTNRRGHQIQLPVFNRWK